LDPLEILPHTQMLGSHQQDILFFSTSQVRQKGPDIGIDIPPLEDANNIKKLSDMDIIVTCQGGDYTKNESV